MTTDSKNRIIGAVIGDVVGSTFEFADKIPTRFKLFRSIADRPNVYLPNEFREVIEEL